MAKLKHTPSMKAGQLSRHNCNQIPRGRYQQTKVQAGPEHQTRQSAGEGRQRGQRKEPQQRRADNKGSNRAHPRTARSATKPGRPRGAPAGAQNRHNPTSPAGQLMQGTTRPPKGQRAAQTIHVQSEVRLTKEKARSKPKRKQGEGARTKQEGKNSRNELEEYECTSHVYGQTRKYRENQARTPYTWEDGAPVHLSRLWTDTPVEMKNPNDQNR